MGRRVLSDGRRDTLDIPYAEALLQPTHQEGRPIPAHRLWQDTGVLLLLIRRPGCGKSSGASSPVLRVDCASRLDHMLRWQASVGRMLGVYGVCARKSRPMASKWSAW